MKKTAAIYSPPKAEKRPARGPPVSDDRLPLQDLQDLTWGYTRYTLIFAQLRYIKYDIPMTEISEPLPIVPRIIEAPLNSAEILEAIFQPPQPFKIYTARHVRRPCTRYALSNTRLRTAKRLYSEFSRLQGRLELDCDISFVCLPRDAVRTLEDKFRGVFVSVQLQYLSVGLSGSNGSRDLTHPWALVLHKKSRPGSITHTKIGWGTCSRICV